MKMNAKLASLVKTLICACPLVIFADQGEISSDLPAEDKEVAHVGLETYLLTRADSLPVENFEDATDPYLEGYIQALIDIHYSEFAVLVTVKDHKVTLSNLPKNELIAKSIVEFVKDIPGVKSVEVEEKLSAKEEAARALYIERPRVNGIWFPESTVLFVPLVADPRQPRYSIAYRGGDAVVGTVAAAVALGDNFPIFRWKDTFRWHGDLQIGIEAGIWAVFNYHDIPRKKDGESCELVNTDYYLGIPLTYAVDKWSFRYRLYHISSHLGDEFLVNRPYYLDKRKNPSFEAMDLFAAYQFTSGIRGYIGPGIILHSDHTYPMRTFYVEYGAEFRFLGHKVDYHQLYGTCFFAFHIENWQIRKWEFDETFMLGYELSKLQGIGRKMRIYIDYHNGYSYEGQFFRKRTSYGEVGFSWGF
ncbi:MAG: DUF1207 domain-containing protein [Chlamydiae bacterium]|nr:DUF1207 domain-containing protein [Chlamydiota bacterium]